MIGALPEHLTAGDTDYPIRSDYRNVLQVLEALENGFPMEKVMKQINWFISAGKAQGKEIMIGRRMNR